MPDLPERKTLQDAIDAQETLRGSIPDAVIDATIGALRRQIESLSATATVEQQRRLVTILFMDIAGSTELIRDLDPEDSMAVMDSSLQALANPVQEFGGRVTRYMGDGFLAVFGLESARENEAEMAVRAGLGIRDVARVLARQLEDERSLTGFAVRVGINTGLVVTGGVTESEETIMGAAVNLAARIESGAPAGAVLISAATRQHVLDLFDLAAMGTINAKGFPEPVEVFSVERAVPRALRPGRRGVHGVTAGLVGRSSEMEALEATFADVTKNRHARFVTVAGEAGIGKSRLAEEFERRAEALSESVLVLRGRSTPESGNLPYGLVRDLLGFHFQILEDDPPDLVRDKLANGFAAADSDSDGEHGALLVGQVVGYEVGERHADRTIELSRQVRAHALLHLVEYFRALSRSGPVVVFLEDIHWSDDSSLEMVRSLVAGLSGRPVLFLGLARPDFLNRGELWDNGDVYSVMRLSPLSSEDSKQLVADLLRHLSDHSSGLKETLVQTADGNPYYLEELIKMLIEDGVIHAGHESWHVDPDRLPSLKVPPTLAGVIQARLDALSREERTLLQQASAVGRVFWDEAIRYIRTATSADPARMDLSSLEMREMVYRHDEPVFAGAVEYAFRHSILREVTYESVLRRVRREYHGLIADWLIERSAASAGEMSGLIAGHLEKAGRNAEALGYLVRAARVAAANYAVDEAAGFYTRSLALGPDEPTRERFELLMEHEEISRVRGDTAAREQDVSELIDISERIGDPELKGLALLRKSWLCFWTGDYDAMFSLGRDTEGLADAVPSVALRGRSHYAMAWSRVQQGDAERAADHARQALSDAQESGERRDEANSYNVLGMIQMLRGDYYTASQYLSSFRDIARSMGDREREVAALSNLGVALTSAGAYESAFASVREILAVGCEIGDRSLEGTAAVNLAWISASRGHWEEAITYAERGIELGRSGQRTESIAEALLWYGHALAAVGRLDDAIAAYNESLSIREELDQPHLAMGARAALARAHLHGGDLQTARRHTSVVCGYLADGGSLDGTWEPFRIRLNCYEVMRAAADPRADAFLEESAGLLLRRSELIPNPEYRRMYLESVPWHRELINERERWGSNEAGASG